MNDHPQDPALHAPARSAGIVGTPWLAFLAGLGLCAVLLLIVNLLDRSGPGDRSLPAASGASGVQIANQLLAIEQRLLAFDGRLAQLERAPSTAAATNGGQAPGTGTAGTGAGESAQPWQTLDQAGAANPQQDAAVRPAPTQDFNAQLGELLEKRDREWLLAEDGRPEAMSPGSLHLVPDPPERAVADPEEGSPQDPASAQDEAESQHPVVVKAVNRLLVDIGLQQYYCVEARLPQSPGTGLRDLSFVERGEGASLSGSLQAGRMFLEYFEPRRARVLLEDCYGLRGGVRVEYPHRRYEIEIPGLLDPGLVDPMLSGALWRPESELGRREVTDGMSAANALNDALAAVENVSMRLRSVDRLRDAMLEGVVIDLEFDREGRPTRTVEAKRAWWELHADSAFVELWCEEGTQVIDGKRRPLFRDRFRHPVRNIQPMVWERLPAVRTSPSTVPEGGAGE